MRRSMLILLLIAIQLPMPGHAKGNVAQPWAVPVDAGLPAAVRSRTAPRVDALPATHQLHLAIALAGRDQGGLDRLLAALADPRSPHFHHYISARQFAARFGPDPAAVRALSRWLATQGLRPSRWDGGALLDLQGTVAQLQRALGVRLSRYRLQGGVRFASDREPLLPAALAPTVSTIVGLSQTAPAFARTPRLRPHVPSVTPGSGTPASSAPTDAHPAARAQTGPGGGYDPTDIDTAYDLAPIRAAGFHGEGMHAALVELASYQPSDVSAYAAQYNITPKIATYQIDGGNASAQGNVEAALDIELLLSTAPSAAIDVYNAPNDGTGTGLVDAYSAVASANNAQVLSLEWVNCEAAAVQLSGFVGAQHRIFQQLAAQGTTVVSATGDAGAYGCADQLPGTDPLANAVGVNLPASDPYVLAVGATDLAFTSQNGAATVSAEAGWSCAPTVSTLCASTSPHGAGSGGGVSSIFHQGDGYGTSLAWQAGAGVSNQYSTGGRQVPDVSISGSYGGSGHEYSIYFAGKWQRGGGTSAAAPEWAALILRIDQNLIQQGLKPLGWANPLLYQIANGAQAYPAFHDVQTGNNLYYNATPGWDYASGLGSPDGWNLLRDVVTVTQAASATSSQSTVGTRSPTPSSSPTPPATASPTTVPTQPLSGGGTSPTPTPSPPPTATVGFPSVSFGANPPAATATTVPPTATPTSTAATSGQVLAFPTSTPPPPATSPTAHPPAASQTARPAATATARHTATTTPRPTDTATPRPTATATARPTASSTPRPTATPRPAPKPHARPKPAPALPQPEPATGSSPPAPPEHPDTPTACPATSSLGNGSFLTGTLACWQGSGGSTAPVVRPSTRLPHRFSVILRSANSGRVGSALSQRFALPSRLTKPMLYVSYWLASNATSGGKGAHTAPARPLLTIGDAGGRLLQRATIVPRREYTWASFKLPLPAGERRLSLTIAIPAQPRGISLLLVIDSIAIGS